MLTLTLRVSCSPSVNYVCGVCKYVVVYVLHLMIWKYVEDMGEDFERGLYLGPRATAS